MFGEFMDAKTQNPTWAPCWYLCRLFLFLPLTFSSTVPHYLLIKKQYPMSCICWPQFESNTFLSNTMLFDTASWSARCCLKYRAWNCALLSHIPHYLNSGIWRLQGKIQSWMYSLISTSYWYFYCWINIWAVKVVFEFCDKTNYVKMWTI